MSFFHPQPLTIGTLLFLLSKFLHTDGRIDVKLEEVPATIPT